MAERESVAGLAVPANFGGVACPNSQGTMLNCTPPSFCLSPPCNRSRSIMFPDKGSRKDDGSDPRVRSRYSLSFSFHSGCRAGEHYERKKERSACLISRWRRNSSRSLCSSLSLSLSSEVELPNYLIILYSLPQLGLPRKYDYYMIY